MIPKLRFQEFEDCWSQVTIAEAASFRRGSFPQPYNIPQWYDDINGMPFVQVVDVGNDFRLKPKTKQMISEMAMPKSVFVPKGSIVITIQGSIGRIALTQYDSYVDRTLLIITEKKLPLDDYFFIIALKKIFDYEKTIAVGGTIKTITKEKLAKFKFYLPHRSEQQRIGNFIRLVDQKINLLTKKKEALETYKKGLMQKIFSQELRFKREDGTDYPEWEAKHLGELCSITTGKLDANAQVEDGRYLFFTCAKEVFRIDEYAFEGASLLISGNGANVGYIHNYKGRFNAYQRTYVLQNIGVNRYYLQYYLEQNLQRRIHREKKDGNTPYIVMSTLTMMKVTLPSENEANKIAKAMMKIDESLEQLTNKLNSTITLKKGLLQQMFV